MRRFLLPLALAAVILIGPPAALADASTPPISSAFNSRITDDAVFLNEDTMSPAAIQTFLNARVPVCQPDPDPSLRRPCLKDYHAADGRSAAQIIYDVSQSIGLNPRVILVTLQKEQSLLTDPTPWPSQYQTAMGYGCPESSSVCNADYYGFVNQVTLGAKLLRAGAARNCGDTATLSAWWISTQWRLGNTVTVDGRATKLNTCATGALYNYTPHRPDSAYTAYNGHYYYGNYNFITIWQRYFGSTWLGAYHAEYRGVSTNQVTLTPNGTRTVTVTYRNTGGSTWTQDLVKLGTDGPRDRSSVFAGGSGWLSAARIRMAEATVAPGQDAHFTFVLTGKAPYGEYEEHFRPLVEGVQWMEDVGLYINVYQAKGTYTADVKTRQVPDLLDANRQGTATIQFRNTGTVDWGDTFRLGTCSPTDHLSALYTADNWLSAARVSMQESVTHPTEVATFRMVLTAPQAGRFTETLCPLIEGVTWINSPVTFTVETGGSFNMSYVRKSAPPLITAGQTAAQWIEIKNTGTATWYNDGPHAVYLGTDNPRDNASPLYSGWAAPNRIKMDQDVVAPGETARFSFNVKGPAAGTYRLYLRPLSAGRFWFGQSNTMYLPIDTRPHLSATFTDFAAPPSTIQLGNTGTAWVEFRNTGNVAWTKSGLNTVRLATSHPQNRTSSFYASDWFTPNRIELDQDLVLPGQVGRFTFTMKPSRSGVFEEHFQPVVEGVAWLQDWGVYFPVTVP